MMGTNLVSKLLEIDTLFLSILTDTIISVSKPMKHSEISMKE
jgi:hypothetical protein